jgi:K+-transporting ATPase ATPase C chain
MSKVIMSAVRALVVLTVLTGIIYPLVVTGIAQVVFPEQANGSLIELDGVVVGSDLIGQQTDDPRYFWWRPSAVDYMLGSDISNLGSSGATNFGATNQTLDALVDERRIALAEANALAETTTIPAGLLFASGSGLDPHISPAAARLQVERVATARNLDVSQVAELVEGFVEAPQLGVLGEPRVNVLRLNLALDALD